MKVWQFLRSYVKITSIFLSVKTHRKTSVRADIFSIIPEESVPVSLYNMPHTLSSMHTPDHSPIVRELCFKVKCFSYMEVYWGQSSSRFINSRRQSSFCRAP